MFSLFTATSPPDIYTLSLHDALPIFGYSRITKLGSDLPSCWRRTYDAIGPAGLLFCTVAVILRIVSATPTGWQIDRKSTRLNSSHSQISYAVFCLKKKKI